MTASNSFTTRGLLVDLDGVVYTGRESVPGAADFLAEARRRRFPFLLVTNNSTTTPAGVAQRLARMGIQVEPDEVLTSAQAAAAYVDAQVRSDNAAQAGRRVLVVGEEGLCEAVRAQGLDVVADGEGDVDWVVAGLDRQFDYARLTTATRAIQRGARFVATNTDALLPVEEGVFLPGAGSIVGAIRIATGIEPVVTGKPEPALFQRGVERLGSLQPHEVAMIGDRLDTDVDGARRAGLRTVLVLTGVATEEEARKWTPPPDLVVPSIADLSRVLGWG